jgi:hypothetical protein
VYSATLTLEPLQTVSLSSGKVTLSHGRWCGKGGYGEWEYGSVSPVVQLCGAPEIP